MAIRIPLNQIVTSKYTIGKEFMYESTYKEYQGFYYEFNNKFFTGREFNINSPELIKINSDNVNILKQNPKTKRYSAVSNQKIYKENKIVSQPTGGNTPEANLDEINFYCKKINTNVIKRIDGETYTLLQNNSLYQTTFVGKYNGQDQSLALAEIQIPGILDWVVSDARGF
jgi:hypothetical protein